MPTQTPPTCPSCQTPMKLIPEGISRSTGKSYPAFWSCPNNLHCGSKPITYKEDAVRLPSKEDKINEKLDKILEKLTAIETFLLSNLGEEEKHDSTT